MEMPEHAIKLIFYYCRDFARGFDALYKTSNNSSVVETCPSKRFIYPSLRKTKFSLIFTVSSLFQILINPIRCSLERRKMIGLLAISMFEVSAFAEFSRYTFDPPLNKSLMFSIMFKAGLTFADEPSVHLAWPGINR